MNCLGASKGEIMAKRTFFAIAFVVLSAHAVAWAQGPGYALQGPYGPPASPWAGGQGGGPVVVQAAYQPGMMQPGTMQGGPMQPGMMQGPMPSGPGPQPMTDAVGPGDPCIVCGQGIPQFEAYGDFLYIRPRNANVAYGVVFNGPLDTAPTA